MSLCSNFLVPGSSSFIYDPSIFCFYIELGGFRSSLVQLIIYFGKYFKVPLWGIQHVLLCDANSYPMGRVHKRAAYAGLRGKKKSTGHCLLLLSEPVADCHQTSFMEVQARHCVLIMKTPLYLSNGAEHYSPPWFRCVHTFKSNFLSLHG